MEPSNVRSDTPQIVVLDIWEDYQPDGKGNVVPVEMVKWQKIGVSTPAVTIEKIARLKERPATESRKGRPASPLWPAIEPAYNAWKNGNEVPMTGTPLGSWPGCPPGLSKALKNFQVRTVEEFVRMPDGQRDRIQHPGIRALVTVAEDFLKAKQAKDAVAEMTADVQRENDELRQMVQDLQSQVNFLQNKTVGNIEVKEADDSAPKPTGAALDWTNEELRDYIEKVTGEKPHHRTGRDKLLAMLED